MALIEYIVCHFKASCRREDNIGSATYQLDMLRNVYYALGPRLQRLARRLWYAPLDIYAVVKGDHEALVPPRGLIFTGAGDFKTIGDKFLRIAIERCELRENANVLDVGCGIGRMARPLTDYLETGEYYGFDIVETGIAWCRKRYAGFDNFHFDHVPLNNDLYNLAALSDAADHDFKYPSEFFDLALSISVFTHMQQHALEKYISEIARVLKHGGYCLCTFFIVDETSDFFRFDYGNYFLHNKNTKDANVGYRYGFIRELTAACGLKLESMHRGWWNRGLKEECLDFQDVLILRK